MSKRVRLDQAKDEDFKGIVKVFRDGVEINRGTFLLAGGEWGSKFAHDGVWYARMLFERRGRTYYPDDEIERVDYSQ